MSDRATVDREAVDFLATVPLLEGLDEAALEQLARVMRRRTVPEGRVLWRQGEHGREVFVVVEGNPAIMVGDPPERNDAPHGTLVVVEPGSGPFHWMNDSDTDALIFAYGAPARSDPEIRAT